MKKTEFSIFQGASSIHVDSNQQRIEEDEALEDQIRRNAELNNELQSAFDDLNDDDECTNQSINSTNLSHGNSVNQSDHQNKIHRPFPLRDGEAHLKNLRDSQLRETEFVKHQLTSEIKELKAVVDEYEKRIAISEAEKERAMMTRDQTHELLVENKSNAIQMQEVNDKLQLRIKSLEKENSHLVGEMETTKLMLSDVQIKYNMVEKNIIHSTGRNTDNLLKKSQERHSAQITMMQQQIDSIKSKYDDLEHEHKNLDIRYHELQRSRESMLIENSETVNQLTKSLEEAQRQCKDLLSRPDYSQENRQLQSIVRAVESEKEDMQRTINKLQTKMNEQTAEMELMDSIAQECGGNNASFESSKFIHRDPLRNVNSSIPLTTENRLARVKEELCKSLNNIKSKREEIKICERQLGEKDEEIMQLKNDENKALVQLNHFRDEYIRMESKNKTLESELAKAKQDANQVSANHICLTNEKYEEEIGRLQLQKNETNKDLDNLRAEYEKLNMQNGKLEEINRDRCSKIAMEERDKINNLPFDNELQIDPSTETSESRSANKCQKCNENLLQIEKLENSCRTMSIEYLAEKQKMQQDIDNAQISINALEEKLKFKNLRDEELETLKCKALEFEVFMRANTRSVDSSSQTSSLSNTPESRTDEHTRRRSDESSKRSLQESETKIRDEMAKIFATEMKSIEQRFRDELLYIEQRNNETTKALEEKNEQMRLLKFTILEERQESSMKLKERDEYLAVALEINNAEKERNDHKTKCLIAELKDKKALIEEEMLSIEHLKRQIIEEKEELSKRKQEELSACNKLYEKTNHVINDLTEKYHLAKRTAMNYKKYSEEKEKHFRSEFERTKAIYLEAVSSSKAELKELEKHNKEVIKSMESDFQYKIEMLKGLISNQK